MFLWCNSESVSEVVFFFKRKDPRQTALDDIPAPSSATKILRDGQLYIERDGKMYTIQGIEVK